MTGTAARAGSEASEPPRGSAAAVEPRGVSRQRVVGYLALSVLALLPAVAMRFLPPEALESSASWRQMAAVLEDIRFGSGLRFWAGVAGAAVMALLLLYPLRKIASQARRLGSVGGWLHLHVVLGLAGPVLILYHCNLGTGGFNANVALLTMLVVTLSGIVGHLVHAPASAAFHAAREAAMAARFAVTAALDRIDGMSLTRTTLITDLEAFEGEHLAPRPGIVTTLRSFRAVRPEALDKLAEARWLIEQAGGRLQAGNDVLAALESYFMALRRAVSHSLGDQLWARWRLFHLPLFLVMIAATALHVIAVWDVDGPQAAAVQAPSVAARPAEAKEAPKIVVPPVRIVRVIEAPVAEVPAPRAVVSAAKPTPIQPLPKSAAAPSPSVGPVAPPVAAGKPAAQPPAPSPLVATAPAAPKAAPAAGGASSGAEPLYAELRRLTDSPPPMGLGVAKGATLAERIAQLKAARFDHAKTRFPLTGKHVRVACESCHTKVLEGTPRDCIACHRQDDIHRGRRPDCARCHTTNRWSEIVRRR